MRLLQLRLILFVSALLLFGGAGYAQEYEWGFSLGSSSGEYPTMVEADEQGNVWLSGHTNANVLDLDPSSAVNNVAHSNWTASEYRGTGFLAKYSPDGDFSWKIKTCFVPGQGTTWSAWGRLERLEFISDSKFYAIGHTYYTTEWSDVSPSLGSRSGINGSLAVLIKYNANGSNAWIRPMLFGSEVGSVLNDIATDSADNLLFSASGLNNSLRVPSGYGGLTNGNGYIAVGNYAPIYDCSHAHGIGKYSPSGALQWLGGFNGYQTVIEGTMDQGVVFAGQFAGSIDLDPDSLQSMHNSNGSYDCFIAKWDSNGNYVWSKSFGGTGSEEILSLQLDQNENIYVLGGFNGYCDFSTNTTPSYLENSTGKGLFVAKYDSIGNLVWVKNLELSEDASHRLRMKLEDSKVFLHGPLRGSLWSNDPCPELLMSNSSAHPTIVQFDLEGQIQYSEAFESEVSGGKYVGTVDGSGNHVFAHSFTAVDSLNGNAFTSQGGRDILVAKYAACSPVSVQAGADSVSLCPGDTVTLSASGASSYEWCHGIQNGVPFVPGQSKFYGVVGYDSLGCRGQSGTYVRVPFDSTAVEVCQGETAFVHGNAETAAGTYYDTITLSSGCDSVSVVTLIVHPTYFNADSVTILQGDSFYVGGAYQTQSGVYYNTDSSQYGCDSITAVMLEVLPVTMVYDSMEICDGDSAFIQGTLRMTAGVYYDTVASGNAVTVYITQLTVHPTYLMMDSIEISAGDSAFLGGGWQTSNGVYYDSDTTTHGCDSILATMLTLVDFIITIQDSVEICSGDSIFLADAYQSDSGMYVDTLEGGLFDTARITQLSILPVEQSSQNITICVGDSVLLAGSYQTTSGTYTDSFLTNNGCDSIVITNLFVDSGGVYYDSLSMCLGDSVFLGGAYQNTAGTYTDSLLTAAGCDSTVVTALSVSTNTGFQAELNNVVDVVKVNMLGDYVWIDCDSGNILVSNSQYFFNPGYAGNFAVVVDVNGCTDTSNCVYFDPSAINKTGDLDVTGYPSPADEDYTVVFEHPQTDVRLALYNLQGQLIYSQVETESQYITLDMTERAAGYYMLRVSTAEGYAALKFMKALR